MINRILGIPKSSHINGLAPSEDEAGAVDFAKQQLDKIRTGAERYIGDYPGVSLGAAVALGVFIGWLVKRR